MEGESICKQGSESKLRTSTESIPVFLLYLSIYEQWENIGPRRIVQTAVTFRNTIIWGLLLALSLPPAFLGFLYSVFWVRNEHKKKEMKVRGFHHVSVGGVWWWGENGGLRVFTSGVFLSWICTHIRSCFSRGCCRTITFEPLSRPYHHELHLLSLNFFLEEVNRGEGKWFDGGVGWGYFGGGRTELRRLSFAGFGFLGGRNWGVLFEVWEEELQEVWRPSSYLQHHPLASSASPHSATSQFSPPFSYKIKPKHSINHSTRYKMGKPTIAYKLIGNQERAFAYHFDRIDTTNWGIFRAINEKQNPRERERKRRELWICFTMRPSYR